ncbi:MAG: hypothetical protein JJT78_04645 [Leptospira sp.]|nr:hypothetical protein [Leptospira sp.]
MSFFSKLFRKSKPNWQEKITKYLSSPKRVQRTVEKELDILFDLSLLNFSNTGSPDLTEWSKALGYVSFPDGNLNIPNGWKHLKLSDFLSEDTQEQLIQALLQPGPHPKLEIFQKIIGQKEISKMIAAQLQDIILEVNKKLNPFSSVFKSTGWEEQMYKIIEGFVPGIQNSIAQKLAENSGDERLQDILKNTIRIVLEICWDDFHFPPQKDWDRSQESGRELLQKLLKDQVLLSNLKERWREVKEVIPREWLEKSGRELLFAGDQDYKEFRSGIAHAITEQILAFNQQTKYFENSLGVLLKDIAD